MRFRRKSIAGLALAVASITALAACSDGRHKEGRDHHLGAGAGCRPDWILPVVPSAYT